MGAYVREHVVVHAIESEDVFDGMRAVSVKGFVIELDGIPGVVEFVEAAETKRCGDARNGDLGRADGTRRNCEGLIRGNSIAGNGGVDVANHPGESCAVWIYEHTFVDIRVFSAALLTSRR